MIKTFIDKKRLLLIRRTSLMERNIYDMWAIRIIAAILVIVVEIILFLIGSRTQALTMTLITVAFITVTLWFMTEIALDFIYKRYSTKFWNDVKQYQLENNIDGKSYFSRKYPIKVTLVELVIFISIFLILFR